MNSNQETMKLYNEMWNNVALKKRPVYSLKGCLESYNGKMLRNICTNLGVEASKTSESKEELIDRLASAIQQDMKRRLSYLTQRQAYFLIDCMEKPYINTISEGYGLGTVFSLVETGWVYWFEVRKDSYFILPEELKTIVKSTFFEEEFFFHQQKQHELSEYIEAFVHLYGVFDTDHLVQVWNQHHLEDPFEKAEVEEFIAQMKGRQMVYASHGSLVYSAGEIDKEVAENMMEDSKDTPYYIPEPEEIGLFAYRNAIQQTKQFEELEKYVLKWIRWQPERVLNAVLRYARIGLSSEKLMEELTLDGIIEPDNFGFRNTFSYLYAKLSNDSHNWMCRGHRFYEWRRMKNEIPEGCEFMYYPSEAWEVWEDVQ